MRIRRAPPTLKTLLTYLDAHKKRMVLGTQSSLRMPLLLIVGLVLLFATRRSRWDRWDRGDRTDRERELEDWHRRAHEDDAATRT